MSNLSENLDRDIYDSVVVAHYRRSTSRVVNLKLKGLFDYFVYNAFSEIADIIPTKAKDELSLGELAAI